MGSPLDNSPSSLQVLRKEFEYFLANSGMALSGNKGKMMDTFLLSLGNKIEMLKKSIPQDLKEVKRMEAEVSSLQAKCDKSSAAIEHKRKLIEESREQLKNMDNDFNQIRIATRDLLLTVNKKSSSVRRRPNTVDVDSLVEKLPFPHEPKHVDIVKQDAATTEESKGVRKGLFSRQGTIGSILQPVPPENQTQDSTVEQSKLPPLGKSTTSIKKKTRLQQSPSEEHLQQS